MKSGLALPETDTNALAALSLLLSLGAGQARAASQGDSGASAEESKAPVVEEIRDHEGVNDEYETSAEGSETGETKVPTQVRDAGPGSFFDHLFDEDDDEPEDYVEESTDAQGHHFRKEVHKRGGFKQVEITSDEPMDMGSIIGQILQAQMQEQVRAMQQGMMQRPAFGSPGFGPPTINFDPSALHDEHDDDEHLEDPVEVIRQI